MPLTTTFANLSARGFGLFGRPPILTTVVFPGGTTTWTAPPRVTNLVSLVGKGGDGGPASSYSATTYFARVITVQAGGYGPYDITPLANPFGQTQIDYAIARRDFINSSSGLITAPDDVTLVFASVDDNGYDISNQSSAPLTDVIAGSAVFFQQNWYNGNMLLVPGVYTMQVRCDVYTPPYNGADTTAFGYTFPGGIQVPASTFTYNNVPVTPGTTYTIVNNGSVTITYYV